MMLKAIYAFCIFATYIEIIGIFTPETNLQIPVLNLSNICNEGDDFGKEAISNDGDDFEKEALCKDGDDFEKEDRPIRNNDFGKEDICNDSDDFEKEKKISSLHEYEDFQEQKNFFIRSAPTNITVNERQSISSNTFISSVMEIITKTATAANIFWMVIYVCLTWLIQVADTPDASYHVTEVTVADETSNDQATITCRKWVKRLERHEKHVMEELQHLHEERNALKKHAKRMDKKFIFKCRRVKLDTEIKTKQYTQVSKKAENLQVELHKYIQEYRTMQKYVNRNRKYHQDYKNMIDSLVLEKI